MSWTDIFPIFTEEQVDDFLAQVTASERALLDEWYGVERVLNPQPQCPEVVSLSLFWKPVHAGSPELPIPTRERMQNAVELGLAERYNPWEHYVEPILDLGPQLRKRCSQTAIRVHLARDLEFLADELVAAGCEVRLMKSSSINFAPGGLWRFLPFAEKDKLVIVTDVDRLRDLESDLTRTRAMQQSGVGAWRVPNPRDYTDDYQVCYQPFVGCQFGVQGGLLDDVRLLLEAFTWHAMKGQLDPSVIMPGCGPVPLSNHTWPSYGFDEYFMKVAAYPRLAQEGMLTFVPSGASCLLLSLDVEYCTWGNPGSELIHFSSGDCCGSSHSSESGSAMKAEPPVQSSAVCASQSPMQKIAFLFLAEKETNHPNIWRDYLNAAEGKGTAFHITDFAPPFFNEESGFQRLPQQDTSTLTQTELALLLLGQALRSPQYSHFMLVSPECVPVRPFDELCRSLELDGRSRLKFEPWAEVRKRDILRAQKGTKIGQIRNELIHFHLPWLLLNREDAELICKQPADLARNEIAAETFFATTLAVANRSPNQHLVNRATTWQSPRDASHQNQSLEFVPSPTAAGITESGCFFATGFPKSSNIGSYQLHLRSPLTTN
ncbi:hypothetical protein AAFN60_03270 [Roseibacillus persicicus]|uniref:hypothetical protein n=1 Tax=Roseibacillus persicicus TaxID=454148 RepID=UPI00398B211B